MRFGIENMRGVPPAEVPPDEARPERSFGPEDFSEGDPRVQQGYKLIDAQYPDHGSVMFIQPDPDSGTLIFAEEAEGVGQEVFYRIPYPSDSKEEVVGKEVKVDRVVMKAVAEEDDALLDLAA